MTRAEFSKQTKRDAIKRSGGFCEAILGDRRCNAPLSHGAEFDHVDADWFSKDNSLDNCAAICPTCHKAKTRSDAKKIAKSKRIRDREIGIKKPRSITGWRRFDGSAVQVTRERRP